MMVEVSVTTPPSTDASGNTRAAKSAGTKGAPPRVLEFGVADDVAWSVGLACGGRVEVYVERLA